MLDDRELLEKRITRELWERVLPLVHPRRQELSIDAGPDLNHLEPFAVGSPWGPPWGTTWFRFLGEIPDDWAGERVEALIDLGFNPDAAGFQCEGLVVSVAPDGSTRPLQGIHPRRTNYKVESIAGPVMLHLEAASNPTFVQFAPSPLGSQATSGQEPLYHFRTAALVVVDSEAEALAYDIEVLDGLMRSLSVDDPRRPRLLSTIVSALDQIPNVGDARGILDSALAETFEGATRHHTIAVGHAHIDTAWLWPVKETKRKCVRTFASAVALMDEYPEYKFVCSSAQHYAWIEDNEPELFAKIVERVERGQWIPIGGMWVEADMNLPSGESLVRQFIFGQRYFEETFGERCTEVWLPDVFGYPAGLPQLFAAAGMKRFVTQKLSWNKQNKFPHSTFWWEGLDGTRVLTHFPPVDTYNAEITPGELAFAAHNFSDHRWSSYSLMPFGHGDGGGGPTREMLERARRLASIDARSTVEVGVPETMFARIEQESSSGAPVPVWRGELYFETHRGTLTSQLGTKIGNRRCERLLVEAELWAATLGRPAAIDDLWKQVLTQQFHDILPGSSIAWVHADAEETFAAVEQELEQRIEAMLVELASSSILLANPADTPLDAVIELENHVCVAIPALQKTKTATQTMGDGRTAARVVAPALGLVRLEPLPVDDRVIVSDSSMTNGHLAVRWDRVGNLTSIIDIAHAREVVPEGEFFATLELAPDHPVEYDAWDLESWTRNNARAITAATPRGDTVAVTIEEEGPLIARVRVERAFGPSVAAVTYELRAGSRQLLVHVELDWHHDESLLSMAFPLDVHTATASCDVQFGVVERPTHRSSPWDAAKFEVCAHRFVDFSEPDFGVAVLNTGRYGHALFDGAIRVSLARAAKYPDPGADHGRHEVTFAVLPHGAGLAEVRAAASLLNSPVRVAQGVGNTAALESPLVSLTGPGGEHISGVEVDAVKLADDGSGDLILRLHEACGNRAQISIRMRQLVSRASRCNLMEEPDSAEEVSDGIVAITLRPFELVTLRLS